MGILKKIFILVLFLLPLGEIVRINLGNSITVKPIDIGVGLVVFLWLIIKLKKREVVKQKYILTPILLFAATGIFSMLINYSSLSFNQFFASLLYLIRWVAYAGIFFVVSDFDKLFKKKILHILVVIGAIIVFFGFIQYFFYSNLRNLYYLGWDEHMHRLFSTFLDPNFAGSFFVLYFIYMCGMFLFFLKNKQKNLAVSYLIVLLFILAAIYLTFSRSALIMLFVSAFTFSILIKKTRLIIALVLVSLIFFLLSSKNFYIENINLFRIASTEARLVSARSTIEIIRDNPFLGVGFNGYRYAQIRYGFRHGENAIQSHADAGTDNSFLFILATVGFIGLISYLYLLFVILKSAYLNYSVTKKGGIKNILSIIVIASFAGIIIDSLFINSLFYSFNMIWLWLVVGLHDSKDSSR